MAALSANPVMNKTFRSGRIARAAFRYLTAVHPTRQPDVCDQKVEVDILL